MKPLRYRDIVPSHPPVSRRGALSREHPVAARILQDRAERDVLLARAWAACSNVSTPSELDKAVTAICRIYFDEHEDPADPFAMERVLARMIEIAKTIVRALHGHQFSLDYTLRVRRTCQVKDGSLVIASPHEERPHLNVEDDLSRLIESAGTHFLFRRCAYAKCRRVFARRGRQEYCVGCKDKAQIERRASDPRHKKQHLDRVRRYRAK